MRPNLWAAPALALGLAAGAAPAQPLPSDEAAEKAAAQAAGREPTRRFKVHCDYVKSAPDDPIVHPNKPGAAHLHDFYGSEGISAHTTHAADLYRYGSSCPNQDRSAYWTPALYRNGQKLTPQTLLVYYENKSLAAGPLHTFPDDFKIVLGNAGARTARETDPYWTWACSDRTQYSDTPPAHCPSGGLKLRSEFPNCWTGKLSADGNAAGQLAWAHGLQEAGRGEPVLDASKNTCPAGFPIPLPMVRMVLTYDTGPEVGRITLSSGAENAHAHGPAGHGAHAGHGHGPAQPVAVADGPVHSTFSKHGDFMNGWDRDTLKDLIDRCLNQPRANCKQLKGRTAGPAASAVQRSASAAPHP